MPAGVQLSRQITLLDEDRLRTLELRLEADLRLGRHRELVGEPRPGWLVTVVRQ